MPDHSVLSKARRRWGKEVFERLFVRSVGQCVEAGLVDGSRLHVDSSLVDANASRDSVIKGPPPLIGALKAAYQATASKLAESATPESYEAVNDSLMSRTDPDAALVRKAARRRARAITITARWDGAHGVITAVETTPGSIAENRKLLELLELLWKVNGAPLDYLRVPAQKTDGNLIGPFTAGKQVTVRTDVGISRDNSELGPEQTVTIV